MLKIALLGGTFNPIHWGHIRIAKALLRHGKFDHFYFVPCKHPLLDKTAETTVHARLEMLDIALKPYPEFEIDYTEIVRTTPSYTIETLHTFRQRFGDHASLSFVIGGDSFLQLPNWHLSEKLLTLAHCIVVDRPGEQTEFSNVLHDLFIAHEVQDIQEIMTHTCGALYRYCAGVYAISSKDIRKKIMLGEKTSGLLPTKVRRYIDQHDLYLKIS